MASPSRSGSSPRSSPRYGSWKSINRPCRQLLLPQIRRGKGKTFLPHGRSFTKGRLHFIWDWFPSILYSPNSEYWWSWNVVYWHLLLRRWQFGCFLYRNSSNSWIVGWEYRLWFRFIAISLLWNWRPKDRSCSWSRHNLRKRRCLLRRRSSCVPSVGRAYEKRMRELWLVAKCIYPCQFLENKLISL